MTPLPFTYVVKGKYWYFRHPHTGTARIHGGPFSREFMRNYRAFMREAKEPISGRRVGQVIRNNNKGAFHYRMYFIGVAPDGPVKIGMATNVERRLMHLQVANHNELELIGSIPASFKMERAMHKQHSASHIRGEWFARSPELLADIDEILAEYG